MDVAFGRRGDLLRTKGKSEKAKERKEN